MNGLRRFFQFIFIMLGVVVMVAMISGGSRYLARIWFPRDPGASTFFTIGAAIILCGIGFAVGGASKK